jgi:transcriptional regulator with XRE-family HTH domain
MKLSTRIRQLRYAKGWGPDDLASRANISRTALYQIESGRTGLPRAATLRRIARALGVTPENLLADEEAGEATSTHAEAAPAPEFAPYTAPASPRDLTHEIEIERKFRLLLRSPLREAMVRIVEESYRLLPPDTRDLAI